MEVPGVSTILKVTKSRLGIKIANLLGFSRQMKLYAQLQMATSAACGIVVAPSHDSKDYLIGGEILQNTWLSLAQKGISMQPMDGVALFATPEEITSTSG